jgi:hypothetical protein
VIAKTGARRVQTVVPNQREWLSVLVCISAAGIAIPSFYIFRGKSFRQNYIQHCEAGATMAMQPRAWMTSYLFSAWISHFIESVRRLGGISPEKRHLLILDGHNSHVTLEVVQEAKSAGLDLLTLLSHTSHALQPLDVAIFKPFKQHFREYRDFWTSRNLDQPATKTTLVQWVSLALQKALSSSNIRSGFSATGIHPLNRLAIQAHMQPSKAYRDLEERSEGGEPTATSQSSTREGGDGSNSATGQASNFAGGQGIEDMPRGVASPCEITDDAELQADLAREPATETEHFYVDVQPSELDSTGEATDADRPAPEAPSVTKFLTLPTITARINTKRKDPIVNFAKSLILTSDQYIYAVQEMRLSKEDSAIQRERQRVDREETRKRKAADKEEAASRRAVECHEAQRLKNECAAERAATLAAKVAAREELARVKAARAAEAAAARLAKAAERSRIAAERTAALLPRSPGAASRAGGRQSQGEEGTSSIPAGDFSFPRQQPQPLHSPFMPYTASFQHPPTLAQMQSPFFYAPPSPISPFPQFDVPLTSTLHPLQFSSPNQVPTSPGQSSCFWSIGNQGRGGVRRGPEQ